MGDKTEIQWTQTTHPDGTVTKGASWNPIAAYNIETGKRGWHCNKVSPGCLHCYAEEMNKNTYFGNGLAYDVRNNGKVRYELVNLRQPIGWKRGRKIFVCSMSDLFFKEYSDEMIDWVFATMAQAPQHTFIVLTKQVQRMLRYMKDKTDGHSGYADRVVHVAGKTDMAPIELRNRWPLPNVWLGFSAENQHSFDERYPYMEELAVLGWNTWASLEPMLGPINIPLSALSIQIGDGPDRTEGLRWIVFGGESGVNPCGFDLEWGRRIIALGKDVGLPVFAKQLGARAIETWDNGSRGYVLCLKHKKGGDWDEWPEYMRVRQFPEVMHG